MSTVYIAPADTPPPARLIGDHIDVAVDWRPSEAITWEGIVSGPTSDLLIEPLNPAAPFGPLASHYRASFEFRTLERSPDLLRLLAGKPPRLRTRLRRALRRALGIVSPSGARA